MKLNVRGKLVLMFTIFGVLPVATVTGLFISQKSSIDQIAYEVIGSTAARISDTIDRNLFERYGDVQAFAANNTIRNAVAGLGTEQAIEALNTYVSLYGIYNLVLVTDTQGRVVVANTKDAKGANINTAQFSTNNYSQAAWFVQALKGQFLEGQGLTGTAVQQPARYSELDKLQAGNDLALVFSAPVHDENGNVTGVIANFAGFAVVEDIVKDTYRSVSKAGLDYIDIALLDKNGVYLMNYLPGSTGNSDYSRDYSSVLSANMAAESGEDFAAAKAAINGESGAVRLYHKLDQAFNVAGYTHSSGAYNYPGLGWSVIVHAGEESVISASDKLLLIFEQVLVVSLIIIVLAGLYIGNAAAKPLRSIVDVINRLMKGELDVNVPHTNRSDELGQLAQSVEIFRDNMKETEALRTEQEKLKKQAEIDKRNDMYKLADSFEKAVSGVVSAVASSAAQMKAYAKKLSLTADQTSQRSTTVAVASEQASANVSTVAAAAEELSASISEITRQVAASTNTAGAAVSEAKATNVTVQSMADAARKIGEVVQLISDIANQTNLLALNATIEAARAGEAGKGFAVVASEVKNLAAQTAKATEDITAQISSMQTVAGDAVTAIKGIGGTIEKINSISTAIAAAVEEQSSATAEISRNVQEAATGTKDVSQNIGSVSEAANETGQVASEVLSASEALETEASHLRDEVSKFISTIRAA